MNQKINLEASQADFDKVLERLKSELGGLRTGRANAAVLEPVVVEAYGSRLPLKSVASITVPDAKTLAVEPWDKNLFKEVEKGIIEANLGLNPINDGRVLRLSIPAMTEENRRALIKILGAKLEERRVELRLLRDSLREKIFAAEKEKLMGEDERYRLLERLDELTRQSTDKIKRLGEGKEQEIMTI